MAVGVGGVALITAPGPVFTKEAGTKQAIPFMQHGMKNIARNPSHLITTGSSPNPNLSHAIYSVTPNVELPAIFVDGALREQTDSTQFLRMHIEQSLTWDSNVCPRVTSSIFGKQSLAKFYSLGNNLVSCKYES
ncbi:hypothetical protein J6590_080637 [Homalodisca vitripennis]|nr:hypothetical protein J6590_080637 [Homalodisca vitripennis]